MKLCLFQKKKKTLHTDRVLLLSFLSDLCAGHVNTGTELSPTCARQFGTFVVVKELCGSLGVPPGLVRQFVTSVWWCAVTFHFFSFLECVHLV